MGSPTTVNPLAEFMNNVVAAVVKGGRSAGEAYILASQPELNNPFIKWFIDAGLDWISSFVDHNLEMLMTGLIIDIQTNGEKSDVYKTLSIIKAKAGAPTPEEIAAAKAAWAAAIHYDGSSNTNISG